MQIVSTLDRLEFYKLSKVHPSLWIGLLMTDTIGASMDRRQSRVVSTRGATTNVPSTVRSGKTWSTL
jgi:hypothetical protein